MVRNSNIIILEILRKNARTPFLKIAKRLRISETAVRKRVRRMEEQGIIKKYTIEIDPRKIGYKVRALIGIDTKPEYLVGVTEKLEKNRKIRSLYLSQGDHMLLLECWFKTSKEMRTFVKTLRKLRGVTRVCPAIILEKVK